MGRYEALEKIVKSGGSKIFKEWNAETGITQEEFLAGLKWLCEDPGLQVDENGRRFRPLERELGCEYSRGLVRLNRVTSVTGTRFFEVETGNLWAYGKFRILDDGTQRGARTSINAEDRI